MIELKNISKSFSLRGEIKVNVLSNLNLRLESGKSFVLFGSNGSGKSTLLNTIRGDILPDEGEIILFDVDITNSPTYKRSKNIFDIKQKSGENLCESLTLLETYLLSVQNNNRLIFKNVKEHKDELISILSSYNIGLEKLINNQIKSLSGGEYQIFNMLLLQKRIELNNDECLVLLDEHLAHLDPYSASKVFSITEDICRNKNVTAIIVSHNINDSIQIGDEIGVLKNGQINLFDKNQDIKQQIANELKSNLSHSTKQVET